MISYLKGIITNLTEQSVSLSLNQMGIEFEIFIPKKMIVSLGNEICFYIHMHWNQENGPTLYGFSTQNEKKVFELVIKCSGIGPKIGLAVLSEMDPKEFVRAISENDIKSLSSINGIGSKKAEQMVLQLKHKVNSLMELGFVVGNENYEHLKSINEVLNSLNYSKTEIVSTIEYLKNNSLSQHYSFDQMLKQALSYLSKRI